MMRTCRGRLLNQCTRRRLLLAVEVTQVEVALEVSQVEVALEATRAEVGEVLGCEESLPGMGEQCWEIPNPAFQIDFYMYSYKLVEK
mmetsp:Transcript_9985/g.17622  ORF Transcript_9985/g.17622 Transcript_9985/m.17622 type:complete len:87 (-) Transcript_9985:7-267(-)